MLREYTASFTSVKPCLYQPPPGTAIEVAPRPAGVKLHVPLRSTEATAAFPAATPSTPAAATPRAATGAAATGLSAATIGPPRATAIASASTAASRPTRRTFERRMTTSYSSATLAHWRSFEPRCRTVSNGYRHHGPPRRVITAG